MTSESLVTSEERRPLWRRVQWIDIVLVVVAVVVLLVLTAELWMPHYGPE